MMAIQDRVTMGTFFSECTHQLSRQLAVLRSAHCVGEAPHYHHIVASNVVRATRLLSAIRQCMYSGISEAAVILARSLYELSIGFYVDWLAPEQIGPFFTFVARIPRRDFRDALKKTALKDQANGWTSHEAELASKCVLYAYDLVANVKAKALLTPLASTHDALYRTLSGNTHQDADTAASFAGYLERELDPSVTDQQQFHQNVGTVMSVVNQAIALLLQCVGSEFPVR